MASTSTACANKSGQVIMTVWYGATVVVAAAMAATAAAAATAAFFVRARVYSPTTTPHRAQDIILDRYERPHAHMIGEEYSGSTDVVYQVCWAPLSTDVHHPSPIAHRPSPIAHCSCLHSLNRSSHSLFLTFTQCPQLQPDLKDLMHSACVLYGLLHCRYILTGFGMEAMLQKV